MVRKTPVFLIAALLACVNTVLPAQESYSQDAGRAKAFGFYQRGLQLMKMGDMTNSMVMFRQCISHDPRNKWAHMYLGLCYSATGNDASGIMEMKNAINTDYNFVEARNNLGLIYKKTGDRTQAEKQFMECIKINPRYPFAYHHLGEILKEKGDLNHAIEAFETAARLKPDYYEAQRDLGLAIFERAEGGDITEAVGKLQIAAKLVPDNPMIHYYLGTIYCADGQLDVAEAEFRRTLMIDPQHAAAHGELAKLRYLRGDLDRPLVEVKECEKINPAYTEGKGYPKVDPYLLKFCTAVCLEHKGKMAQSVDTWKELSNMTLFNAIAVKHIMDIEKKLRADYKRRNSKKNVIAYDPEEIDALVSKGINQYDDGDLDGAKASFQRALELNPESFEAMQNLGACLEAAGDLNGAMAKYQAAAALKPGYDGALYNLGYMLEKLNLPADAGLMYQRYHEISGKYPYNPKHVIALQQEDARRRAREEQVRRRGY
jgi:tetratricopeptide (TPR) repeat protein